MMRFSFLTCLLDASFALHSAHGYQDDNPFGDQTSESVSKISADANDPSGSKNPVAIQNQEPQIEFAEKGDAPKQAAAHSVTWQNDRKALAVLEQTVSLDFLETPFETIQEALSKKSGCQFILDISAIDDSLSPDQIVSFRIRNTRLRTALRLMLRDYNATYVVDDGIVRIISQDDAFAYHLFRRQSFDCRDLLALIDANERQFPSEKLNEDSYSMPGGFGGGNVGSPSTGGGIFNTKSAGPQGLDLIHAGGLGGGQGKQKGGGGIANYRPQKREPTPASQLLINLIQSTVSPDYWIDNGGEGQIMMVGGILVVAHDERTLQDVQDLLTDLEQQYAAGGQPAEKQNSEVKSSASGSGEVEPGTRAKNEAGTTRDIKLPN